ncbi:hypothetical protein M7I_7635 [Glarea lozoyensis 74030]|uniref:Uncharacterized protein n=1 Tax=Glarea lozoyensis (strain ATCC 74030 / MF5533) TaxID=1104152 RepID=H0EXU5_GLAL7|nr:hypothetical protein M7I_7635 [Glarea lozoyensis 74030]
MLWPLTYLLVSGVCWLLWRRSGRKLVGIPEDQEHATDIPSSLNDSTFDPSYYLDGYEGCDGPQELAIKDAFTEAIQLIGGTEVPVDATGSMITEYPAFEWTSAGAIEYFGPAERTEEYRYTVKGSTYVEMVASMVKENEVVHFNLLLEKVPDSTMFGMCQYPTTTQMYPTTQSMGYFKRPMVLCLQNGLLKAT